MTKSIYVLMFQPFYTGPITLGHFLTIEDAKLEGEWWRSKYIDKLENIIQWHAKEVCRYWVLEYEIGLNLSRGHRFVFDSGWPPLEDTQAC